VASILTNPLLSPAITDLQTHLSELTGTDYTVGEDAAAESITLSLVGSAQAPADAAARLLGKGLTSFLIKRTGSKLEICANDVQGISHGIYYYLELAGFRWLLPSEKWRIVPADTSDATPTIDTVIEPDIVTRGFAGTGGFYSTNWGRNYAQSAVTEVEINNWKRRLRYGGEYNLGGHIYQAFHADPTIKPTILANPDSTAIIDGVPYGVDTPTKVLIAKINAGNPTAVARFTTWLTGQMAIYRTSADKRRHGMISCEPSDGGFWGNNTTDLVSAGVGDGSAQDQAWFIANAAAVAIDTAYPGALVQQLAYNLHATPPSFEIEPNIVVQVTPYAFQTIEPDRFITMWAEKATRMAMYDYWSIPDWVWDEPVFEYQILPDDLRYWAGKNIEGIQAETTHGAGPMGIGHYIAAHMMWNLDIDEAALIDEWYTLAFGAAKVPMKRMMERWAPDFLPLTYEISASYADMDEALGLVAADAAAKARVLDYGRYLHYLRLRCEMENLELGTDAAAEEAKALEITKYLIEIDDSRMVHGTRIIDLYARDYPAIKTEYAKTATTTGPAWASISMKTDSDIETLMDQGLAAYSSSSFERVSYTGALEPLAAMGAWTDPGDVWGTIMPTIGNTEVYIYVRSGMTSIPLKVNRQVANDITATRVSDGEVLFETDITAATASDWTTLTINDNGGNLVAGDVVKISFFPEGSRASGYFKLQTKAGIPLNFGTFISPKNNKSPRMYFYVPAGVTEVVFHYPLGDYNNVFNFIVRDSTSTQRTPTYEDARRVLIVSVPVGQDDAVWSMQNSVHPDFPMLMLTTPQTFALEPSVLWVPSDAMP
jgi:hypothetical protein